MLILELLYVAVIQGFFAMTQFNMCAIRMFSLAKIDRKFKGALGLRLS